MSDTPESDDKKSEKFQANNPQHVAERKQKAKLQAEQQEADLRELLNLPAFRRYLWRHINKTCHLFETPFSPNGSTQTLNIGFQDVGRTLWAEVERVDAAMIPKMMLEYREAQA